MGGKAIIAFLLLLPYVMFGQPFTESELAWPINYDAGCNVSATAGAILLHTNTSLSFRLGGSGGEFSITTNPTNGTISALDSVTGDITYSTTLTSAAHDYFVFMVSNGVSHCAAIAPVDVTITDTNSGCLTIQTNGPINITVGGPTGGSGCGTTCITMTSNGVSSTECSTVCEVSSAGFDLGIGNYDPCVVYVFTNSCGSINNDTNSISYFTNHVDLCGSVMYAATWSATGNAWNFTLPTGGGPKAFAIHNEFCDSHGYTNILVTGKVTFNVPSGSSGAVEILTYTNLCSSVGIALNINNGAGGFTTNGTDVPISFSIPLIPNAIYTNIVIEPSTANANCSFSGALTNTYQ